MNRRSTAVVLGASVGIAIVVVPLLAIVVRAVIGDAHPGSVFIGSAISAVFLGVSPALSLLAWGDVQMRGLLLRSYVIRVLILITLGLTISESAVDSGALVTGVLASAAAFIVVQMVGLSRKG